jgi:hypothetical protein
VWLLLLPIAGLVGFVSLLRRRRALKVVQTFAIEFRRRFIEYANSNGANYDAYHWMTLNANKMQGQMGSAGIMSSFRDPPYTYSNYPVIINMLPSIRRDINDGLLRSRSAELTVMFDEILVRYLGTMQQYNEDAIGELRNPLRWFFAGVEQMVSIPLYFVLSFGLVTAGTVGYLQKTFLFRSFSALVVLLGIVASIISVVNDGKAALGHLRALIGI